MSCVTFIKPSGSQQLILDWIEGYKCFQIPRSHTAPARNGLLKTLFSLEYRGVIECVDRGYVWMNNLSASRFESDRELYAAKWRFTKRQKLCMKTAKLVSVRQQRIEFAQ